jgi:1,6-anhydro-N-acetylmuramate kinase
MLATGGGAFNTYLMEVLAAKLLPIGVIIAKAPDYEI